MRATQRRTAPYPTRLLCAVLGFTGFAGLAAACTDAIHLDPPAATSTSGTTSSSGGGTGGAVAGACQSSVTCAFPKPVCDTVTETCVECLTASDCAFIPGLVCSLGKCTCLDVELTYCPGEIPDPDGGPPKQPACVNTQVSPANCGTCGHACAGCAMGTCPTGAGGGGTGGSGGSDAGSADAAGE